MSKIKKCLSFCLALLILLSLLPAQALAAEVQPMEMPKDLNLKELPKLPQPAVEGEPLDIQYTFSSREDKTQEELYEGYAMQLFYPSAITTNGSHATEKLVGDEKKIADALGSLIPKVADGDRASAIFTIGRPVEYEGEEYPVDLVRDFSSYDFTQYMFDRIINALLLDLPYHLYWFDKVSGCAVINGFVDTDGRLLQLTFAFTVAENYRGKDEYTANTQKTGAASRAVDNAWDIIEAYEDATDYERLVGYKDEINALVSYDFDAAEGGYFTTDIDPWQMISVFDGDPDTNVVCEGYSKAYLYLVRESFEYFQTQIICYTVTGYLEGVPHMWNIVEMSSNAYYLVDVTNSDTGTVGENGGLFLAGGVGNPMEGYIVGGLYYQYDFSTLDLYGTGTGSILNLKASNYNPNGTGWEIIASGTCGAQLIWTLDNAGLLTISGTGDMDEFENGSSQYSPWYNYKVKIQTVVISEGVTYICKYAFANCSNLTVVSIPSTVKEIGNEAFLQCYKLSAIRLPDGLTTLGEGAFSYCDSLTKIVIPEGITEIPSFAFNSCESLKEVTLPAGLVKIDYGAFDNCVSLVEITLPDKLAIIFNSAFRDCKALVSIRLPGSLTSVGSGAFFRCESLTDVYFDGSKEQWEEITKGCNRAPLPNHTTLHFATVETPAVTKIENVAEGVKVTWGKVDGAARYRVYAKETGGSWKNIGNTTDTSFVWTGAESGKTYTFTVRCVDADNKNFTSEFNTTGWKHTYVAMPAISKLESATNGVKLTWNAVPGAAKYRVYVKTDAGWKALGDTTATTFTYTGAKSGETYTFTVRCISDDGKTFTSYCNTTGWKHTYVATPSVSKVENVANGIKLTWNAVPGAAKYRVFIKSSNGWTKVADTTATNYVYTAAKSGETYTFTIRCVDATGKTYTSAHNSTGWKQTYVAMPAISKLESVSNGVKLTWDAVPGAVNYRVFVKVDGGWKGLGNTTGTSFTWTGAELGKSYTFTVRCMASDGKTATSSYNTTGWSHKFNPAPVVTKLESTTSGVKLTWGAIKGAVNYRVFIKTDTGWKGVGSTTGTSFTWTGAETGETYTFTVRCMTADGKTATSAYNTTGWTYKYNPAPEVTKLESTSDGIKLTWGAINGAGRYRVYVMTSSGWSRVGDSTTTSFTWTGAEKGNTYTFTVRCLSADGKAFTSTFSNTGWSITYK